MTTVLIADDDLMRAGLVELLTADPGIEVVGEAATGRDAVTLATNKAYCQKSSVCHQATSSSRSGSVSPWRAAAASTAYRSLLFAGHGMCTRAGTARGVPPRTAGPPGWPRTSPARPRPGEGTPRRERCCPAGAAAQARSPARRCQHRGRARRAGHGGRPRCPRRPAASWQAYPDGRAEPPIAGWPCGQPSSTLRSRVVTADGGRHPPG